MKALPLTSLPVLILVLSFCSCAKGLAPCDTLDGPVVAAARQSLQKGDVTPVLKWLNAESEKEIRETFALTVKVRAQGEDARKLADLHFFETLVRVHRAGEGVPYTGLKPAGTIDPAIQAADQALQEGVVDKLAAEIASAVWEGLRKRFADVIGKEEAC
jgi:hypothetical protein